MDRARPIYLSLPNGKSPKFQACRSMTVPIVPDVMSTDGGSVPQVFSGIPGLSPWGLGPAYIIHDWLFEVRRCGRNAPPEVKAITFEQSRPHPCGSRDRSLSGLAQHGMICWMPSFGVCGRVYARALWDRPGSPEECKSPALMKTYRFQRTDSGEIYDLAQGAAVNDPYLTAIGGPCAATIEHP